MQEETQKKKQIFSARLKGLRLRKGLSQADLAKILGVSIGAVGNWEAEENIPASRALRKIADLFGVSIGFLLGEPDIFVTGESADSAQMQELVRELGEVRFIPVVSWVKAGPGAAFEDPAWHIDERIDTTSKDPDAYGLIVENNSMEPEYRAGDRIVVEPFTEPINGDVVVARLRKSGEVMLKMYHKTADGKIILSSFNRAYPEMTYDPSDFKFIHPVFEMKRFTRRRR